MSSPSSSTMVDTNSDSSSAGFGYFLLFCVILASAYPMFLCYRRYKTNKMNAKLMNPTSPTGATTTANMNELACRSEIVVSDDRISASAQTPKVSNSKTTQASSAATMILNEPTTHATKTKSSSTSTSKNNNNINDYLIHLSGGEPLPELEKSTPSSPNGNDEFC